ncbi:MAG: hypothetical protein WA891_16260 [Acidobacteriaceae bacterium]
MTHLDEYVRGEVHTQGIENFWSLLKRTLSGTLPWNLFTWTPVPMSRLFGLTIVRPKESVDDQDRFMLAVSQVSGKRLAYAELTGKVGETTF